MTDFVADDEHYPITDPIRGHDEMNLAEFPMSLLRREDMGRGSFLYEGSFVTSDGVRHHQTWEIRAGDDGMPTEYDERVLIALLSISGEQGFQSRKVIFSVYQILRLMQAENQGQAIYTRVVQALDRLSGVRIVAQGSFWDNSTKAWDDHRGNFGILNEVWLRSRETDEEKLKQEGNAPGYFEWSKQIWRSIKSGYVKYLDLGIYYQLKTPIARRLYRFLDKRLYKKAELELDIFELAGKLAMSDTYKYAADLWRKLGPGIDELKAIGFLQDATRKKVGKYTRVVFTKAQGHSIITLASNPAINSGNEDGEELQHELQELGVDAQTALRLTEEFEPSFIREKLNQLRKELRRNSRSIHNPAGWIIAAVRKDFGAVQRRLPLPEEFLEPGTDSLEAGAGFDHRTDALPAPRSELDQIWKQVKDLLEITITRATFDSNVRHTTLVALDENRATIAVRDEARIRWLEGRLKPKLVAALASVVGTECDLRFVPVS